MEPDWTLGHFKQDQQAEYIKQNKRTGSIQLVCPFIYTLPHKAQVKKI